MTPSPAPVASPLVWASILQALPHAAWVVLLATQQVLAANAQAAALFGRPLASMLGAPAEELAASPEDGAFWQALRTGGCEAHRAGLWSEALIAQPGGGTLPVHRSIRLMPGANGPPEHALVMLCDRSVEYRAEQQREELLADLQATLEATGDGILVVDLTGRIRSFNQRFAQIWGLPLALLQQHDDAAVFQWMRSNVHDADRYEQQLRALQQNSLVAATERITLQSGQVLERVLRPLWREGRLQGQVHAYRDLSQRIASDARIEQLCTSDSLTGLPNRRALSERLERACTALRQDSESGALLVIDLDRFRQINDSLGHDHGDRVLLDVARRMRSCLRDSDMLARIGGDQFGLLLGPADERTAETMARRVLKVVAQPSCVDGVPFTLTCSVGMALWPSHGRQADDLMRHAEAAMRSVKLAGRASFKMHQARAEVDRRSRMKLDHAMRQALVSNRFRLHYQPQVNLADGRLVGAEALLRWRDPEMGEVPPARFIPVAEDSGFIIAIGDWVLSQAVRQAAVWYQRGHGVPVAVNVSALQFQQPQFVDRVARVLAVSGMPAHLLELELTESVLVHDADETLLRLRALAALGVRLSIDDFGTGYSSLSYLKRFPIGRLKIDRSFVSGLPSDDSDAGIVRAILQMARALGMKVIAEGVETEAQRQFLCDNGCDEFQGFLVAPALDNMSFEQRLTAAVLHAPDAATLAAPRIRLVRG